MAIRWCDLAMMRVAAGVLLAIASAAGAQPVHLHLRGMDMSGYEFGQPPPAESAAQLRLDTSLRLGEYVEVPFAGGAPIRTWVVYPLRNGKAPALLVIHESAGLSDWTRAVADQAAAEGYLALAPDLVARSEDDPAPPSEEVARRLAALSPEDIRARLDAVRAFATTLPIANGKVGALGFGWGGSTAFTYATQESTLAAVVVYYGQSPDLSALASVRAPVLGLYPQDDGDESRRVKATASEMKRLRKTFQVQMFKGATGPFLRQQEGGRDGANEVASVEAWFATFSFFRKHLGK